MRQGAEDGELLQAAAMGSGMSERARGRGIGIPTHGRGGFLV